jgi:hypothetical protein
MFHKYDYSKFNFSPETRARLTTVALAGDITPYTDGVFGRAGDVVHQVVGASGFPAINAGELVSKTLGNEYVITNPTSGQVVGTNYLAGVSTTASTETATVAGTVSVTPITPGQIWLIAPGTAATWNTQALYNALVGSRVLIQKSAAGNTGAYTILASDSANNGCVVENLNIATYPGKVAFSLRAALAYTA